MTDDQRPPPSDTRRPTRSGEEVQFYDGPIEAVVLPTFGARIHRLRAFGHDLLRTPADIEEHHRDPFYWGAYPMIPWCNRLATEPLEVAGRRVEVEPNFSDGSAIHGQLYDRAWEYDEGSGELSVRAGEEGGWPWAYLATMRIALAGRRLRIEQTVYNLSGAPMPAGVGLHPWFRRPVEVRIGADLVFASNVDSAPSPRPVEGAYDRRRLGEMAPDVDATWARLSDPPVELFWPTIGVAASMHIDARTSYVTAASPRDADAIAVEPQTHAPQGLRRLLNGEPGALELLAPAEEGFGGSIRLRIEIVFSERTAKERR